MSTVRTLYTPADGKWAWRLTSNGNIIATDGGQGYENESDCRAMANTIIGATIRTPTSGSSGQRSRGADHHACHRSGQSPSTPASPSEWSLPGKP